MLTSHRVCTMQYCQLFQKLLIFLSKNYIGIISDKIECKFSRALVDFINIQQKEERT